MKPLFHCLALLGLCAIGQAARIKDVALVEGGRDNQIVGYGLVVGLAGDGDSNAMSTLRSLANTMQRYGISLSPQEIKSKNVAAVMVTATLPPFTKQGNQLDVTVSSLGDAKSMATHPATTTHMRIGAEERAKLGITDGTVRISVGLEDVADIVADLQQALG